MPHAATDGAVQLADAVAVPGHPHAQHRHIKGAHITFIGTKLHEGAPVQAEGIPVMTPVLLHQGMVKGIITRRDKA